MSVPINFKEEIEAKSNEINYLVNSENFTRQEAIKLALTLDWIREFTSTP